MIESAINVGTLPVLSRTDMREDQIDALEK